MNNIKFLIISIFLFSLCNDIFSQDELKEVQLLKNTLEENHYKPRLIDDKLSGQIFARFIYLLDPNAVYFTPDDLKKLSGFKYKIDDELNNKTWNFIPAVAEILKSRLNQSNLVIDKISKSNFDILQKESILISADDTLNISLYEADYQLKWKKWLKAQTMWYVITFGDSVELKSDKKFKNILIKAQSKTADIEKRLIKKLLNNPIGFQKYVSNLFFNSITFCFDPHTNYFSKTEWENFQSMMSTESFSFGVDLKEDHLHNITIAKVVPGGPAWKTNEIHKGDILISVKWEGEEETELAGADVFEVNELFQSSNSKKMEFTIRKSNAQVKKILLQKEKITDISNIVKSFILSGEKKIGYISLPGFYTEWENNTGQGCANDVAKEIIKLKEEKIEGLILDIRFNGGGSLLEGINLAGIFINEGPVLMVKDREGKIQILKDMNRGTVYDGPLTVMVNGQSASASEVLAATLQDYNRAVIIGSQTYGKSTGQVILPLDTLNSKSSTGVLKVTTEKLYRITGKSAQLKGVVPQIYIPDIYERLEYRESFQPFVLNSDSVSKKVYYQPLKNLPINDLKNKSSARVEINSRFKSIKNLSDTYPKNNINSAITLNLDFENFKKIASMQLLWMRQIENTESKPSSLYTVSNTHFDKGIIHLDAYGKELNDDLLEMIKNDIYIEENYNILKDLIKISHP